MNTETQNTEKQEEMNNCLKNIAYLHNQCCKASSEEDEDSLDYWKFRLHLAELYFFMITNREGMIADYEYLDSLLEDYLN